MRRRKGRCYVDAGGIEFGLLPPSLLVVSGCHGSRFRAVAACRKDTPS